MVQRMLSALCNNFHPKTLSQRPHGELRRAVYGSAARGPDFEARDRRRC